MGGVVFIAGFVTEEPEGIIAVIDDIMFREIENGSVYRDYEHFI